MHATTLSLPWPWLTKAFAFTLLALTSGCGLVERGRAFSDEPPGAVTRTRFGTPISYQLADPTCGPAQALSDIGRIKVWLAVDGKAVQQEVDLSGFSGDQLKSAWIATTLYDYESHIVTRTKVKGTRELTSAPQTHTVAPGKALYFCRKDGGGYPRESLENVALATAYGLAQAGRLHDEAHPGHPLTKVNLLIHPRMLSVSEVWYTSTMEVTEKVMTDNASWSEQINRNRSSFFITVLPHSQEAFQKVFLGIALWEHPGWAAHEFGHHMFDSVAPRTVRSAWAANDEAALAQEIAQERAQEATPAATKAAHASDGINEGFADLVAYFSFYGSTYAKLRLGYFTLNRNVVSCECDCQVTRKVLDAGFTHHYFSGERHQCMAGQPSANSAHSLGAILAYGFHALLADSFGHLPSPQIRIASLQALLAWAKRLDHLHTQHQGSRNGQAYLLDAIASFLHTLEVNAGALSLTQCKLVKATFPIFVQERASEYAAFCRG